jgi:solute carrier family 25 iron transporter 28/37
MSSASPPRGSSGAASARATRAARAAERAGGLATTSDRAGTPPFAFASFAAPIFHRQDDARGPAPPRASGPRTPPSPARANHPAFAAHSPGEDKLFYGHMVAGALAGTTEHTAMFPLDTIKTRMQTASRVIPNPAVAAATKTSPGGGGLGRPSLGTTLLAPPRYVSSSMRSAASSLLRAEGVAGLYRGVAAVAVGAGPAHAVYFATYEKVKASAMARRKRVSEGDAPPTVLDDVSPEVLYAFAGACATIVGDAVQTPVDTIKQRLQMSDSPYKGVWDCARRTVREQGPGALYRSYPTTLAMNVPFTAIHFSAYESSKRFLGERLRLEGGEMEEESFLTQFTAGGFAGGLAAACTTPLDVVKTRMQTHCELAECPEMTNVKKRSAQFAAPAGDALASAKNPSALPAASRAAVCAVTGDPVACKAAAAAGGPGPGGAMSGVTTAAAPANAEAAAAKMMATRARAGGVATGVGAGGGVLPEGRLGLLPRGSHPYGTANLAACMRSVVREEGWTALGRGLGPRVLFHIPAGAISWATYEAGKRLMGIGSEPGGGGGHHH